MKLKITTRRLAGLAFFSILFSVVYFLLFNHAVLAQTWYFRYDNPITHPSFTSLLQGVLRSIHSYVAWLAIVVITISGMVYMLSTGNPKMMALAKNIFVFALVGFTIAVAAPSLLRQIVDFISAGGGSGSGLIQNATEIREILLRIMQFSLTVIGILAIIGFVISGIMYLSAGADTSRADKAKKGVFYSIVAVAISGAAIIIINQIIHLLSTTGATP